MTRLALAAALLLAATPAFAQNWTSNQVGDSTFYRNNDGWRGTSNQVGDSTFSSFHGPDGQTRRCTSNRIGDSVFTNCN